MALESLPYIVVRSVGKDAERHRETSSVNHVSGQRQLPRPPTAAPDPRVRWLDLVRQRGACLQGGSTQCLRGLPKNAQKRAPHSTRVAKTGCFRNPLQRRVGRLQ
jgi:hypothetical protein